MPLINKNSTASSLTTKRNMLKAVQTYVFNYVTTENVKVITKQTLGTTTVGTVGLQIITTGGKVDGLADKSYDKTQEFFNGVVNNTNAPVEARVIA